MNENRLSRVAFNNQSFRLCGAAHAARTRIRMATRNRSRRQGSGGGLGTDTALVLWDTGNCHILLHASRERRL